MNLNELKWIEMNETDLKNNEASFAEPASEPPQNEVRQKVAGLRTRGNVALRFGSAEPVSVEKSDKTPVPAGDRPTTADFENAARDAMTRVAEKRDAERRQKKEEQRAEREREKALKAGEKDKSKKREEC